MDFDDNAILDTSQVSDRRGMGMAPIAIGGTSVVGIIIFLLVSVLGGTGSGTGQLPLGQGSDADLGAQCRTGADADQSQDCRVVAVVNSLQRYWQEELAGYRKAKTVLFSGVTNTACGHATSAVGPFYCPADQTVYIDLDFFKELQTRFKGRGGAFAEAYVLAHEYGHHVQHLRGTDRRVGNDTGPLSGSVRLELQADCYAGVWASNATGTGIIDVITDKDIEDGLAAAAAVGDDRIQRAATGRVSPEKFSHGTSQQRQRWFLRGYQTGDPEACDTFSTNSL